MTLIVIDHEISGEGHDVGRHLMDLDDPATLATLTHFAVPANRTANGPFSEISKHPNYVNMTRWQVITAEVRRVNHVQARAILGV